MKIKRSLIAILILAGALFFLLNPVASGAYTINLPNAALSSYPPPYGTLDVALDGLGTTATFTFTSPAPGPSFTYFFVDGSSADVNLNTTNAGTLTYSYSAGNITGPSTGGFTAPTAKTTGPPGEPFGSGNVSAFGSFNLTFDLEGASDAPANQIIYSVLRSSGSWTSASDVLTGNDKGFVAAAHIAVFDTPASKEDGAIVTGFAAAVPEPGILILLGIAMTAVGVASRYVRKI